MNFASCTARALQSLQPSLETQVFFFKCLELHMKTTFWSPPPCPCIMPPVPTAPLPPPPIPPPVPLNCCCGGGGAPLLAIGLDGEGEEALMKGFLSGAGDGARKFPPPPLLPPLSPLPPHLPSVPPPPQPPSPPIIMGCPGADCRNGCGAIPFCIACAGDAVSNELRSAPACMRQDDEILVPPPLPPPG